MSLKLVKLIIKFQKLTLFFILKTVNYYYYYVTNIMKKSLSYDLPQLLKILLEINEFSFCCK